MGNCCTRKISVTDFEMRSYDVLLLGLQGAGKTTIGNWAARENNIEDKYPSTVGVHKFYTLLDSSLMTLTEVGGSEDIRPIWHHYYHKVMSCIYVIDLSDIPNISFAYFYLKEAMNNKYLRGKPFLVLATKLSETTHDLIDFNVAFGIEEMANRLETPILLNSVSMDDVDHKNLFESLLWLKNCMDSQYHELLDRMRRDTQKRQVEERDKDFLFMTRSTETSINIEGLSTSLERYRSDSVMSTPIGLKRNIPRSAPPFYLPYYGRRRRDMAALVHNSLSNLRSLFRGRRIRPMSPRRSGKLEDSLELKTFESIKVKTESKGVTMVEETSLQQLKREADIFENFQNEQRISNECHHKIESEESKSVTVVADVHSNAPLISNEVKTVSNNQISSLISLGKSYSGNSRIFVEVPPPPNSEHSIKVENWMVHSHQYLTSEHSKESENKDQKPEIALQNEPVDTPDKTESKCESGGDNDTNLMLNKLSGLTFQEKLKRVFIVKEDSDDSADEISESVLEEELDKIFEDCKKY